MSRERASLESTYAHRIPLWTTGVRDYHTMLSDYLTAHSIFVAVIGLIVSREPLRLSFTVLIALLCAFGVLMCLQMAIVLGHCQARMLCGSGGCAGSNSLPTGIGRSWSRASISSMRRESRSKIHGTSPRYSCRTGRSASIGSGGLIAPSACASGQDLRFSLRDQQMIHTMMLAVHSVYEHISLGGQPRALQPMIATNVYQRTERGWRMVAHHAAAAPASIKADITGEPATKTQH